MRPARWGRITGLLLAVCVASGCYVNTQRHPSAMRARANPLEPGARDRIAAGPEEVLVVRQADPVRVQPAGLPGSHPLLYYQKQERMTSGAWVFVDAGGRAEVLWPSGTTVTLFGRGTGVVASPSRGEPAFVLLEVDHARVQLTEGEAVELLGGSVLSSETGPFLVDRLRADLLRIHNRSKGVGRVAFRDESIVLDPGQAVDLPLLAEGGQREPHGGRPFARDPDQRLIDGAAGLVLVLGEVEVSEDEYGTHVRADGEHELEGLGVRLRLNEGEEAHFLSLGAPDPSARRD